MSATGVPGRIATWRAGTEQRQEIDMWPCLPSTSSAYNLLWKAVHASKILAQVCIPNLTKRKIFKNRHQQQCIDCFPVDCVVGNWSTWGLCSQSCGGGLQGRGRDVIVHSDHGGVKCPTDLAETRYCINEDCPKGETDWLSWWHILIILCRGCSWTWSSLGNKFFWKTPGKECFVW